MLRSAILIGLLSALVAGQASAQSARTFVSGQGVDSGTCALATPCRSFAYALTQTAAKGELAALDTAGFGPMTITQTVSVLAPPGVSARITVSSGAAITVNGSDITVTLTGIGIDATGLTTTGILFTNGANLSLERMEIYAEGAGVQHNASDGVVKLSNSILRGNLGVHSACFVASSTSSSFPAIAIITGSRAENCNFGIMSAGFAKIAVVHSAVVGSGTQMVQCAANFIVQGDNPSELVLDDVVSTSCYRGVVSGLSGAGSQLATVSNSLIYANEFGAVALGTSSIRTFSNNRIFGNSASNAVFNGGTVQLQ